MEVKGKLHFIGETVKVSSEFTKREIVVKTDEQYRQFISINFVNDKCDMLNQYKVGMEVTVDINLRGREWVNPAGETKYFNDLQGWRISQVSNNATTETTETVAAEVVESDLPF